MADGQGNSGHRRWADGFSDVTRAINTAPLASTERKPFSAATLLNDSELTYAYRQNWLAMDAVQRPAIDIVRAWWEVQSDEDPEAAEAVDRWLIERKIKAVFKQALIWSRLYGGAVIFLGVDDGQPVEMPVSMDSVRAVRWWRVVDRRYVQVLMYDHDPESPTFDQPLLYSVGQRRATTKIVHASRILRFVGEPLPDDYREEVNGFGDSVLERSWDSIDRYQTCARSLTIACERFIQSTFKVKDLASWIGADDGAAQALKRLQALNAGLYTGNVAVIDSEVEAFERMGLPMTGLTETLAQLRLDIAGALKRPASHIFGQQQGTTRTGAGADLETYHTNIQSLMQDDAQPQLEQLIDLIVAAAEGPTNGQPLAYSLRPGLLSQPSAKDQAEIAKIEAEAADILIQAGVMDPMEARAALMGEGSRVAADPEISERMQAEATASRGPEGEPEDVIADAATWAPPANVRAAARRGLKLRAEQPPSNRAGTAVGLARATQLATGRAVSLGVLKRMVSYFARHEVDKDGEGWGKDSKGYQAWLMWGGDAGRAWAERIVREQAED